MKPASSQPQWRLSPNQFLATLLLISWLIFLAVDYKLQLTIVPSRDFPGSELYGPLSCFQPVCKYATFALTITYLSRRWFWPAAD